MKKLILSSLIGASLLLAVQARANFTVFDDYNKMDNFLGQCLTSDDTFLAITGRENPNTKGFTLWYRDGQKFACKEGKAANPLYDVRCSSKSAARPKK